MPDELVATEVAPVATDAPAAPEVPTEVTEPDYSKWSIEDAVKEIKKTRQEAATYRTRLREAEEKASAYEPFSGLDPADVSVLAEFAGAVQADPTRAAEMAKTWATELTPAEQRQVATEIGKDASNALTRDDVLAIMREERQKAAEEAEVAAATRDLEAEARGLGFEPGTRDYFALCLEAHNNQNGSLKKAAEVLSADRQKVIDEYLAAKTGDASTAPALAPDGSVPGNVHQAPRSLEEARAQAKQRIAQAFDHAGAE